jgi:glycine cleavage system aminomethyltransferase T
MGFIDRELAALGRRLSVEVIGQPVSAEVTSECLYDPENTLPRA